MSGGNVNPFSPKGEHKELYRAVMMNQNILLQGPGGTGKSFLLRLLAQNMKHNKRNVYCTATTGIAALNLSEGTDLRTRTLHSWAGIGLGKDTKEKLWAKIQSNKKSRERWQNTDILIIDEVSMLGKSLFEKLDYIGRKVRECEILPFGGIQLIFSGDFLQLPPIKDDFPFESPVWNRCNFYVIPFLTPRRYNDLEYFEMLLRFRRGEHTQADLRAINACVKKYDEFKKVQNQPSKKKIKLDDEPVIKPTILHSRNIDVDKVNSDELEKIEAESEIYFAKDHYMPVTTEGASRGGSERFYENMLEETMSTCIQLKPGAQVMLKTNLDLEGGLVNGSRGVVLKCHSDSVDVKFNNDRRVKIVPHTWEFQDECMIASRTQIPLILAYSTSIHKSQGCTLDNVICNLGQSIFLDGQAYVALSRVRNLGGLYLSSFYSRSIKANQKALDFENSIMKTEVANKTNKRKLNDVKRDNIKRDNIKRDNIKRDRENDVKSDRENDVKRHKENNVKQHRENDINIQEQNDNSQSDDKLCVICIDNAKDIVFIPCGHVSVCKNCSDGLKICPLCRSDITTTNKIFL
jgi:ATP-dependent DNA helicase PIF1